MWGEEAWSKWCESVQQLKNVGFDSHQRSMIASWGYQIKYKWIISKNQCQSSSNNFTSKSPAWYRWRWDDKAWFAGLRLLQNSIIDQIFYWLLTKINNIGNEQHSLFWTSAQNWQMAEKKCSDVCEFFKLRLVFWTNKFRGFWTNLKKKTLF